MAFIKKNASKCVQLLIALNFQVSYSSHIQKNSSHSTSAPLKCRNSIRIVTTYLKLEHLMFYVSQDLQ